MTVSSKAIRYALTGVVASALLAGGTAYAGNSQRSAARDAAQAQSALVKGQAGKAIRLAEAAVLAAPGDAGYRALLGHAYLRAGRFESAAVTLDEARQLGDASGRTALGLALARIGSGNAREAVTVLDTARDAIAPGDIGLAYAMAGETGRGVAILSDALRASEPSAKLRQNLAYAYALDGRWREARIMMLQDVPANQVEDRVNDWASRSKPEDFQLRVAAMVGAPVVSDEGRSDRLALVKAEPTETEQAAAVAEMPVEAAAVAAAPAPVAPVAELPAVAEDNDVPPSLAMNAPASQPAAETPAAPAPAAVNFAAAFSPAPATAASATPVVQSVPVKAAPARPVRAAAARVATTPHVAAAPAVATGGSHLVQLGSFSSESNARRAWSIYTARNASLRSYRMTITPVVVRGKNFWRVAAGGFNAAAAHNMCSSLKARGGACFAYAADRPLRVDAPRFADAGGGQRARRR